MVMIGRTVTPGDFMSISRNEMPDCGLAAGSVRTRQKIQSACWASVVQVLWPDDVMIAVTHGLGAHPGEIGSRARLGIALAPPVPPGENTRHELALLSALA